MMRVDLLDEVNWVITINWLHIKVDSNYGTIIASETMVIDGKEQGNTCSFDSNQRIYRMLPLWRPY